MEPDEERWRLGRERYEEARYQFIVAELELGITFANIALSSRDRDARERNIAHARLAYDTATRQFNRRPMSAERERTVQGKVRKLHRVLQGFPTR